MATLLSRLLRISNHPSGATIGLFLVPYVIRCVFDPEYELALAHHRRLSPAGSTLLVPTLLVRGAKYELGWRTGETNVMDACISHRATNSSGTGSNVWRVGSTLTSPRWCTYCWAGYGCNSARSRNTVASRRRWRRPDSASRTLRLAAAPPA